MTETIDLFSQNARRRSTSGLGFAHGEIATLVCQRCKAEALPWELRSFAGTSVCLTCYDATLELASAAIRSAVANGEKHRCTDCRALRNPSLGSAWCAVTELGPERATICVNFVHQHTESAIPRVAGGRAALIEKWRGVTDYLRGALGDSNFATWFASIEPVSIDGDKLVLAVPDDYTRDWLEQRLQTVMLQGLAAAGLEGLQPLYRVDAALCDADEKATSLPSQRDVDSPPTQKIGFNPHYTFAEFIVGAGNRLAHASSLAVVDKPGRAYNPLVLYGGVGVGKTHLLQAIGQEAIDQGRGRILYATSETFTNELIQAIREGRTNDFRERYRTVDVLLIDDIQFIAGKEATQEEFFHTFNALHQSGKQIVVTCDRPPKELRVLEDRLRSRFEWGLLADVQPPDLETRIAIVRAKAAARHSRIPETVLEVLASRGGTNVRELEGSLNRVLARADLLGTEPGMEIARSVLGEASGASGSVGSSEILQAIAAYYRIKPSDLAGPQRDRATAYARQMAMYLLREEAKLSLVDIGNQLGGRNHSTVIYGCDKVAAEVKRKGRSRQDVQALKQLIYGLD